MNETPEVYDVTQAQAVIEAERQARAERAAQRIAQVLEEERCALDMSIESVPLGNGLWGQKPNARIVAM
jgi:hypothetical protein